MSSELIFIYTTWPNEESATKAAQQLVETQLIACANITPNMKSIYSWDGKMAIDNECLMILKTRKQNFSKIEETLLAQHPYKCPCIVSLPVVNAHKPYQQWLEQQTLPLA